MGQVMGYTSPRHPSQIYEAIGEGLLSLALLWFLRRRIRYQGVLIGIGLSWYALARFAVEFFREKDDQMRYYFGWMTMGQILCGLMLAVGLGIVAWNWTRRVPVDAPHPDAPAPEPELEPAA
jgi:phosphatidylglycerol:prolipoprotein diacylglycerol transferase